MNDGDGGACAPQGTVRAPTTNKAETTRKYLNSIGRRVIFDASAKYHMGSTSLGKKINVAGFYRGRGSHAMPRALTKSLQLRRPLFLPPTKQQHGMVDDYIFRALIRRIAPLLPITSSQFPLAVTYTTYRFSLSVSAILHAIARNRSTKQASERSSGYPPLRVGATSTIRFRSRASRANAPSNMQWQLATDTDAKGRIR